MKTVSSARKVGLLCGSVALVVVAAFLVWHFVLSRPDGPRAVPEDIVNDISHEDCKSGLVGTDGKMTDSTRDCGTVTSSLAKQVLADGQVSKEELQAVKKQYVDCLSKMGFTSVSVGDDGSESFLPKKPLTTSRTQVEKDRAACSGPSSTDWDPILLEYLKEHPDSQAEAQSQAFGTSMAACLVKAGIAPKGFAAKDYFEAMKEHSLDTSTPQYEKCADAAALSQP